MLHFQQSFYYQILNSWRQLKECPSTKYQLVIVTFQAYRRWVFGTKKILGEVSL